MVTWLEKHLLMIKLISAFVVTALASSWAVVEFIYPEHIKPRFSPGKLSVEITITEVGSRENYTAYEMLFRFINSGNRRIYLPDSQYSVNAYKISAGDAPAPDTPNTSEMTSSWFQLVAAHQRTRLPVVRAPLDFDRATLLHLQIGKISAKDEFLDPGDITDGKILLFIPGGFDAFEVVSKTFYATDREVFDKYWFIGRPTPTGLGMLYLDASIPLQTYFEDPNKILTVMGNEEFQDRYDRDAKKARLFYEEKRIQVFIARPPENEHWGELIQSTGDTTLLDEPRTPLDDLARHLDDRGLDLDDLGIPVDEVGTRLDEVGTRLDDAGTRLDDAGTRLDDAGTRLDEVGTLLDDVPHCLDEVPHRLDRLAPGKPEARPLEIEFERQIPDATLLFGAIRNQQPPPFRFPRGRHSPNFPTTDELR